MDQPLPQPGPSPGSQTRRQRTESGQTIPRPQSPPPGPPITLPAVRSNKKQRLNQIMNLFQGNPVETYTEDLNQSKQPEPSDLVWLRPARTAKKEMELSGILKDNWTLLTLTLPDRMLFWLICFIVDFIYSLKTRTHLVSLIVSAVPVVLFYQLNFCSSWAVLPIAFYYHISDCPCCTSCIAACDPFICMCPLWEVITSKGGVI